MKKIIILCVLFICLVQIFAFADSIPGYFSLHTSISNYRNTAFESNRVFITQANLEYGIFRKSFFSPFLGFGYKTWVLHDKVNRNYPFLERYNFCVGFNIYRTIYVKASHACTHFVLSDSMYKKDSIVFNEHTSLYPDISRFLEERQCNEDKLEIGINFIID